MGIGHVVVPDRGAVDVDCRGESIWDRFCNTPGRITDGSSGADAYPIRRTGRGSALVLFAINDSSQGWEIAGTVRRARFDGTTLAEMPVAIPAPSWSLASLELPSPLTTPGDSSNEVLVAECGGERTWWWFAPDHASALAAPTVTATWEREADAIAATISTDVLVRDLTIYPDRLVAGATIDQQLISVPGERTVVRISGLGNRDPAALLTRPYCWSAGDLVG